MSTPTEIKAEAIALHALGYSCRAIGKQLRAKFPNAKIPNHATINRWVRIRPTKRLALMQWYDAAHRAAEILHERMDELDSVPFMQGERVPNLPKASGVLAGIRPGLLRRGHLFRAALEGTSLSLALGMEMMKKLGIAVESVRLVGGGSRNVLWRKILGDVLGVPVLRLVEPELAALGAAVQALWTARREAGDDVAADVVAAPFVRTEREATLPDPARSRTYRKARARFRELTERIFSRP